MVYECPQCKTPLPPGVMACAKCGLQFATPIPADATIPATGTLPPAILHDPIGYSLPQSDSASPNRVWAVVTLLGVLLIAAVIFAVYTFTRTPASTDAVSPPSASTLPPPPAPGMPPGTGGRSVTNAPVFGAASSTPPIQLVPGTSSRATSASANGDAALQGRWEAKNMDFYVFNSNGTGSRGNTANAGKAYNFTWVVTDNQLVLNGSKEERLTFSTGPDANFLYLQMPDGHYAKYAKASTS